MVIFNTEDKSCHFFTKKPSMTSHLIHKRMRHHIIWPQGTSHSSFSPCFFQSFYSRHKGLLAHIHQAGSAYHTFSYYLLCLEGSSSRCPQSWHLHPNPTMPSNHRVLYHSLFSCPDLFFVLAIITIFQIVYLLVLWFLSPNTRLSVPWVHNFILFTAVILVTRP